MFITNNKTENGLQTWSKVIKYVSLLVLSAIVLATAPSCEYDYPEPMPIDTVITPDDTVSFSLDIQPILTPDCATGAGCHSGTYYAASLIDLSEGIAYDEIMFNGDKAPYVDTANPEVSLFYTTINTGGTMEQYTIPADRTTILKWITEGAKNN